jgi:hypothetical protein
VERYKTVAFETPKDFKPPTEWTPPIESALRDAVLIYKPAVKAAQALVRGLIFSGIMVTVIGGFIAYEVTSSVNRTANGALADLTQPEVVNGVAKVLELAGKAVANRAAKAANGSRTLPIVCSGNDYVTITGETLVLPSGVPILATGNCTVHLTGCTVEGTTALTVKNNAAVVVEGGSLKGEGPAVIVMDNGSVDATAGATITGEPAIVATLNAKVSLSGATVTGRHTAITTTNNATVDTSGASIVGAVVAKHGKKK